MSNAEDSNDLFQRIFSWAEGVAFLVSTIYVLILLYFFMPMEQAARDEMGMFGLGMAALVNFGFAMLVATQILVRQLAMPAAIGGAIYIYLNWEGLNQIHGLAYCALAGTTMLLITINEARVTTGKLSDFWKSFFLHPVAWTKKE